MVFRWGQAILSQFAQLSFHNPCALCERKATTVFCQDCYHQLRECQQPNSHMDQRTHPPLFAWGSYSGALRRALTQLKYSHKAKIAQPLGQWLGLAWSETQRHRPWVIPIPLHYNRQQERGYNQAALIARSFCHTTGLTLFEQGLIRIRATEAQFNLAPVERSSNVEQAFQLGENLPQALFQKPIVLVDDIYTTGATVRAATQTLQAAGISVMGIVTVAQAIVSSSVD